MAPVVLIVQLGLFLLLNKPGTAFILENGSKEDNQACGLWWYNRFFFKKKNDLFFPSRIVGKRVRLLRL